MKEIHVRRHAEKNPDGSLTAKGIRKATEAAKRMPEFKKVIASDSKRTQQTAQLLTGVDPLVDTRAGYTDISPEKIIAIERIALEHRLSFFGASERYQDMDVLAGFDRNASSLSLLVDELFNELNEGEKALIVSHEVTIIPAVIKKGISRQSINPLEGYVLRSDGSIETIE